MPIYPEFHSFLSVFTTVESHPVNSAIRPSQDCSILSFCSIVTKNTPQALPPLLHDAPAAKNVPHALPPLLHEVQGQRPEGTQTFHLPPLNHADLPPLHHGNRNNPSNMLTSEFGRGGVKGRMLPHVYIFHFYISAL